MPTGELIKKVRKAKKMTQKQLSERCGIADSNIRKYENGKQFPKWETLERIAAALEVDVFELIEYEDEPQEVVDTWRNLIDKKKEVKTSSTQTLKQLLSTIKNIIIENDNANIFTELPEEDLLYCFWNLNDEGQQEALKRIEELTEIKKYTE